MPRTTVFSVTRDDIIKAALRKLEVIGEGETPSTEDYINCAFALNLLIKGMEVDGCYLWKVSEVTVPLLTGVASYQIGPTATGTGAVVTDRPIKVIDTSYVRDASGLDTNLQILTRQEYNQLGFKATASTPSMVFYDPLLSNGVAKFYGVPVDATHTAYLTVQTPVYDFNTGSEVLDFPQEGYQAVVYGLADEVMDEYPLPSPSTEARITQRAAFYRSKLADFSQEEGSVFLQPAER
jgi:hypothetical protein